MPTATKYRNALRANHQVLSGAKCPPGDKFKLYRIDGDNGLCLRVFSSGTKKFVFRYQEFSTEIDATGNTKRIQRMVTLGTFPDLPLRDARARAAELRARLARGENLTAPKADRYTVSDLAADWDEKHVLRKLRKNTTRKNYQGDLNRRILPTYGDMPANALRRQHVIKLRDNIAADGATRAADSVVSTISAMYHWGVKQDAQGVENNPAYGVDSIHTAKAQRHMTDAEIAQFVHGLDEIGMAPEIKSIMMLLLLTGQRRTEVVGATLNEFEKSPTRGLFWSISSRTGNKSNKPHCVPLAPWTKQLWLDAIERFASDTHVFAPGRIDSESDHISPHTVTNIMAKMRKQYGLEGISPHNLRHTVRTKMAELDVPRDISRRCINHSTGDAGDVHDSVYNHWEYFDEKRDAFAKWEQELKRILEAHS